MSQFATPAPANRQMSLSFPPDQPFVPDGVDKSDGLTSEQRREAQQHITRARKHTGEMLSMDKAIRDYSINLAMQSVWFGGASYLIHRGFFYSDHTMSFAASFTKNKFICRLMNPVSIVGLVVAGVTAYQLPTDVSALFSAREARAAAEVNRDREAKLFESKMEAAVSLRKQISGFDEEAK